MTYEVISSGPSPYARKVRIALLEKDLPFKLRMETPWDSTTETPQYNPLEKLPVLILPQNETSQGRHGTNAVYESRFIVEWLEMKHTDRTPLLPRISSSSSKDVDDYLFAKQVEVVCDGASDSTVLLLFEGRREHSSPEWTARQQRKLDGGLRSLGTWVREAGADGETRFLLPMGFSLADVSVGSLLGFLRERWPDKKWESEYPELKKYGEALEKRSSFLKTKPQPMTIKDKVV